MMSLSNALRDGNASREHLDEARTLGEQAFALYQQYFPLHPFRYMCATNLAIVLRQSGDVGLARELNTEAYDTLRTLLGLPAHPYVLCAAVTLSNDLAAGRDHEAAVQLSGQALELSGRPENRGEMHPYTLACRSKTTP